MPGGGMEMDKACSVSSKHMFFHRPIGMEQEMVDRLDVVCIFYAGVCGFTAQPDGPGIAILPFPTPGRSLASPVMPPRWH
jgi:hypothetical protein